MLNLICEISLYFGTEWFVVPPLQQKFLLLEVHPFAEELLLSIVFRGNGFGSLATCVDRPSLGMYIHGGYRYSAPPRCIPRQGKHLLLPSEPPRLRKFHASIPAVDREQI